MNKLSIRIADQLLRKHYIEDAMYNIYQYGMQAALEIGCSIIASVIISLLLGMIVEGLIFFIIFIPLRTYLGGFHMRSFWSCFICSCATQIGILVLVRFIEPGGFVSWVIFTVSIIVVYYKARQEKAKDDEGKYFYSKIRIIIIGILLAGIAFTVSGTFSILFLIACTCALVAISKILENDM